MPERVDLVPFWLPQMDQDIRKPVSARSKVLIERPNSVGHSQSASVGTSQQASTPHSPTQSVPSYHEPVSEGEDDEEYLTHAATNEEAHLRLPPNAAADAKAARDFREQKLREQENGTANGSGNGKASSSKHANGDSPREAGGSGSVSKDPRAKYDPSLRIDPLMHAQRFDKNLSLLNEESLRKLNEAKDKQGANGKKVKVDDSDDEDEDGQVDEDEDENGERVVYVDHFKAPEGKRIAVPVRVEPKVVFAAERTFLKVRAFLLAI